MLPALVLAAGLSSRMGRFKMTLPWGDTTVVGQVVANLRAAGAEPVVVVAGYRAQDVRSVLDRDRVSIVFNPDHERGEMLSSIQIGLRFLEDAERGQGSASVRNPPVHDRLRGRESALSDLASGNLWLGVLLCLGDQPQMEVRTIRKILARGGKSGFTGVIIPSYRMRAGHPIFLPRSFWPEIMTATDSLRAVLARNRSAVEYVEVDTDSVLEDLDTPADYERSTPISGAPE